MYFDESVMTKLLHTIIKSLEIIIWPYVIEFCSKQLQIIQKDINLYQNYPHNLF